MSKEKEHGILVFHAPSKKDEVSAVLQLRNSHTYRRDLVRDRTQGTGRS